MSSITFHTILSILQKTKKIDPEQLPADELEIYNFFIYNKPSSKQIEINDALSLIRSEIIESIKLIEKKSQDILKAKKEVETAKEDAEKVQVENEEPPPLPSKSKPNASVSDDLGASSQGASVSSGKDAPVSSGKDSPVSVDSGAQGQGEPVASSASGQITEAEAKKIAEEQEKLRIQQEIKTVKDNLSNSTKLIVDITDELKQVLNYIKTKDDYDSADSIIDTFNEELKKQKSNIIGFLLNKGHVIGNNQEFKDELKRINEQLKKNIMELLLKKKKAEVDKGVFKEIEEIYKWTSDPNILKLLIIEQKSEPVIKEFAEYFSDSDDWNTIKIQDAYILKPIGSSEYNSVEAIMNKLLEGGDTLKNKFEEIREILLGLPGVIGKITDSPSFINKGGYNSEEHVNLLKIKNDTDGAGRCINYGTMCNQMFPKSETYENFGQFKYIVQPSNNSNPSNAELYDFIMGQYGAPNYLQNGKKINIFAYGFSGSGKTYTLIEGRDSDLSILKLFFRDILDDSFINEKKIQINSDKPVNINVYYPLINNNSGVHDIKSNSDKNLDYFRSQLASFENTIKDTINSQSDPTEKKIAKLTEILENLENLMIDHLFIMPTSNNPNSSRAFTIIEVNTINTTNTTNKKEGTFRFIDLPGIEKTVDIKLDLLFSKPLDKSLDFSSPEEEKSNNFLPFEPDSKAKNKLTLIDNVYIKPHKRDSTEIENDIKQIQKEIDDASTPIMKANKEKSELQEELNLVEKGAPVPKNIKFCKNGKDLFFKFTTKSSELPITLDVQTKNDIVQASDPRTISSNSNMFPIIAHAKKLGFTKEELNKLKIMESITESKPEFFKQQTLDVHKLLLLYNSHLKINYSYSSAYNGTYQDKLNNVEVIDKPIFYRFIKDENILLNMSKTFIENLFKINGIIPSTDTEKIERGQKYKYKIDNTHSFYVDGSTGSKDYHLEVICQKIFKLDKYFQNIKGTGELDELFFNDRSNIDKTNLGVLLNNFKLGNLGEFDESTVFYCKSPLIVYYFKILQKLEGEINLIKKFASLMAINFVDFICKQGEEIVSSLEHIKYAFLRRSKDAIQLREYDKNENIKIEGERQSYFEGKDDGFYSDTQNLVSFPTKEYLINMSSKTGIKGLNENVSLKYIPNISTILNDEFENDTNRANTKYLLLIAMMRKENDDDAQKKRCQGALETLKFGQSVSSADTSKCNSGAGGGGRINYRKKKNTKKRKKYKFTKKSKKTKKRKLKKRKK